MSPVVVTDVTAEGIVNSRISLCIRPPLVSASYHCPSGETEPAKSLLPVLLERAPLQLPQCVCVASMDRTGLSERVYVCARSMPLLCDADKKEEEKKVSWPALKSFPPEPSYSQCVSMPKCRTVESVSPLSNQCVREQDQEEPRSADLAIILNLEPG